MIPRSETITVTMNGSVALIHSASSSREMLRSHKSTDHLEGAQRAGSVSFCSFYIGKTFYFQHVATVQAAGGFLHITV